MNGWPVWCVLAGITSCALPEQTIACAEGGDAVELFDDAGCNVCLGQQCCAQASACAREPGCQAVTTCFKGCGADSKCFERCRTDHPHDAAALGALLDCAGKSCEQTQGCVLPERAVTCPEAGGVPDLFGIVSCDLCVRRFVCSEATICAANEGCRARASCMSGCTGSSLTPACFDLCRDDGLVGPGDAPLFLAVEKHCRDVCEVGSRFECVDAYGWPTTSHSTVEIALRVENRIAATGFEGLAITPCSGTPGPCVSAGSIAVTDAEGIALLTVPTRNPFDPPGSMVFTGFRGFWKIDDPQGGDWLPVMLYRMRPEYRNRAPDEPAPFASGSLFQLALDQIANVDPDNPVTLDPTRGSVVGGVFDCRGNLDFFAHGVLASTSGTDEFSRVAYLNEAQVAFDRAATATTKAGQFGFVNVRTGSQDFQFHLAADGRMIASFTANVEAGVITVLGIWPTAKR